VIAAATLLGYAALLLAAAPRLARAGWPDRAPRLAIAAWLALAYSAVASAALAGLAPLIPAHPLNGSLAWLSTACDVAVRAGDEHPGAPVLAVAGGVLTAAVVARVAWCAAATLAATARAGRRHQLQLRLAEHRDKRLGALVVDHAEPAAYCLPGTRRPVVVTTAALRLLDDTQLAAVVAHERAHQAGRHHLLVALAALPAAAFGRVPAFRHARDEVARLAELAADDAAAARSPRLAVAGALLALGSAPALAPALGAGGSTAAARVRRLIAAPNPLSRAASTAGGLAVAALSGFPLVLLAAPACCVLGAGYL
jgi:Zn-dependent protease with chaperone function